MQVDNTPLQLLSALFRAPGEGGATPNPNAAKKAEMLAKEMPAAKPPTMMDQAMPKLRPMMMDLANAASGSNEAATPPGGAFTVDGLLAAWGQTDSSYDINGDGTVEMNDLRQLLSRQSGAVTPEAETPPTPMTINGLMEVWGQDNAQYDFNEDGIVNYDDLRVMLRELAAMKELPKDIENYDLSAVLAPPAAPVETPGTASLGTTLATANLAPVPAPAPAPAPEIGSVSLGITPAPGTSTLQPTPTPAPAPLPESGSPSLNTTPPPGASNLQPIPTPAPAPLPEIGPNGLDVTPAATPGDAAVPGAVNTPAPPLTVDGLLAEWGERGSRYDFDRSGSVDMNDLRNLLSRLSGSAEPVDPRRDTGTPPSRGQKIGMALVKQLQEKGFLEQPPSNLPQVLEHLKLTPDEHSSVVGQLKSSYPHGLGVNMLG